MRIPFLFISKIEKWALDDFKVQYLIPFLTYIRTCKLKLIFSSVFFYAIQMEVFSFMASRLFIFYREIIERTHIGFCMKNEIV